MQARRRRGAKEDLRRVPARPRCPPRSRAPTTRRTGDRMPRRPRAPRRTPPRGCTLSTTMSAASSPATRERILGRSNRLVGREGNIGAASKNGHLLECRHRLLDVLELVPIERLDCPLCFVDGPGPVCIDTDLAVRAERVPHRLYPRFVGAGTFPRLRDLDLRGGAR